MSDTPNVAMQVIYNVAMVHERLPLPGGSAEACSCQCPTALRELIISCWDHEPNKRPSAEMLQKQLERIHECSCT